MRHCRVGPQPLRRLVRLPPRALAAVFGARRLGSSQEAGVKRPGDFGHRVSHLALFRGRGMKRCFAEGTRPFRIVGWRRCARQQPHENRGTTDGSLASQTKSCLTGHAGPLPGRSERPRLNVSRSESLPKQYRAKLENYPSGACRCRSLLALCAQSIEITWIAAIQSGRFATETS